MSERASLGKLKRELGEVQSILDLAHAMPSTPKSTEVQAIVAEMQARKRTLRMQIALLEYERARRS